MSSPSVLQPVFGSALLHAGAAIALLLLQGQAVPRAPRLPEAMVVLEQLPPPKAEPTPVVEEQRHPVVPAKAPLPAQEAPKRQPRNAEEPERETRTPEQPAPAPPVRLSGIRLSNLGGDLGIAEAHFAGPPGLGNASSAQLNAAVATQHAKKVRAASAADNKSDTVALADLSGKPQPPNLDSALRRHYPPHLQARGLEGEALVRARILPTGLVAEAALLFESESGFGQACLQTLKQSVWSSPRDAAGVEVSTHVRYRCQFRIGR